MSVKGDLKLEIDELGIEVRITITPDENGAEITADGIQSLLAERKVRSGIDTGEIDRALRTLARKKTEPVSFVAASGTPPQGGGAETVAFEPLPIPERLAEVTKATLASAPSARGFRVREERVKRERKVLKKGPLPFLPAKEEIEVVFEKKTIREPVQIDPTVKTTGYVEAGKLVARVKPPAQGKEGKSVFGRLVPAPRPPQDGFLFCEGLSREGAEVKAEVTGFLRRGDTWCDIVPFRDHVMDVTASTDGLTCIFSFTPGDASAPTPDSAEVLARAGKLGFAAASLLSAEDIDQHLREAIARSRPIVDLPITPILNGIALVTVSPDHMKAVLYLRKGRGGGTPLTTAAASEAIRSSRVKGFNVEKVRTDLKAFFAGKEGELADYLLVQGRAPRPATEQKIEWRAMFLPAEEADRIKAAALSNPAGLAALASLEAFPEDRVEAVARVKADGEIVKITPAAGGEPGIDVYGQAVPPDRAGGPEIRLFEGVVRRGDTVVAKAPGILEKGSDGPAILLRVRSHRDAELQVVISPDRMNASVSYTPAEGDGLVITPEEARTRIGSAGVTKGIIEERFSAALDNIGRGAPLADFTIAEGKPPHREGDARIVMHVGTAAGSTSAPRRDGSADFRSQDRISRVKKGDLIATVRARDASAEDGWDVTGAVVEPQSDTQEVLKAGKGVRESVQKDGSVLFTAEAAGELCRDGTVLTVAEAHVVNGDISLATGNVKFPGIVRVSGSVRAGFTVIAEGMLDIGGFVEASLLSAGGSIVVGQGIKGDGKAILRSKRDVTSAFAEQAVLLAIGDVHLHGPCVRCQVKCNGRLILETEKGTLVGGEIRASRGIEVQNIGSPGGTRTVVSFGQDFLVKDQIEREEREVATLTRKVADIDAEMVVLEKQLATASAAGGAATAQSQEAAALSRARAQKLQAMKLVEQRKLRLIGLRDKYDEHVASEVVIRGTLYPGAILESHGRRYESPLEKKMITLHFDPKLGKIVEKA